MENARPLNFVFLFYVAAGNLFTGHVFLVLLSLYFCPRAGVILV